MKRLFIDSSVLFAAAYSPRQLVLEETRRDLAESAPERLAILEYVTAGIPFERVKPTKREVMAAAKRIVLKDAPILAGARKARVGYLVTLDKKPLRWPSTCELRSLPRQKPSSDGPRPASVSSRL
jgi:hypothetical protein